MNPDYSDLSRAEVAELVLDREELGEFRRQVGYIPPTPLTSWPGLSAVEYVPGGDDGGAA